MSALPPDRREHLRAFIPAETAQKILAAGVSQERRLVTALFCDVVGSTALGERFGPERFKVVMDQVLGRIIGAVARYEGTIAQLMGDGVLAFFGAPLAHEDDPERAVRAALDVRDAVGAFSSELQAAYGVPLQVRAGLNTGAIVLSRITDVLEVAYNALGDTVTTAARLQSAAAYAVRALNSTGIQPDIIVARAERPLDEKRKEKIAVFCSVRKEDVISAPDVESIYDVPLNFEKDHLSDILLKKLSLKAKKQNGTLKEWEKAVKRIHSATHKVHIGIVGKYFKTGDFVLSDAYISVIEALKHAGCAVGVKVVLDWIDSTDFEKDKKKLLRLKKYDGILIPGGFGSRGVEGKIRAVRFCRENNIPYFGLCYGMQLAVIEYARNVLGLTEALTTEIDQKTVHPVVDIMPEQKENLRQKNYGATMRLGHYEAKILPNTIARIAYGKDSVLERHRHRYEVNPAYVKDLEKAGLVFSATSPNGVLMEIAELPQAKHPFFLGTQFHPEFQSSLLHPHPLFVAFVKAASERKNRIES